MRLSLWTPRTLLVAPLLGLLACAPPASPRPAERAAADAPADAPAPAPRPAPTPAPEAQVIEAEVARAGALERLAALASAESPREIRLRALQALGRRGDPAARALLEASLADDDPEVVAAAARGLGLAGDPSAEGPLLAALGRARGPAIAGIADGLSRCAGTGALPGLAARVEGDDRPGAIAAALALGRLGRRGIPLDEGSRAALVRASAAAEPELRYAATFALAREAVPLPAPALREALLARALDEDPEVRAEAFGGLARRGAAADPELQAALRGGLRDPSWLVALAAIRGLSGPDASPELVDEVANAISARWGVIVRDGDPGPELHVVEEGLARLGAHATVSTVPALAAGLASMSAELLARFEAGDPTLPPRAAHLRVAASRVHCRALALALRGGRASAAEVEACGGAPGRGSALHLRRALLAELAGDGLAGGVERLRALAADDDPRVVVAALAAASKLSFGTDQTSREGARALLVEALAAPSPAVVGAAAEGIVGAGTFAGTDPWLAGLGGALAAAHARFAGDPEVALALLGALKVAIEADARTGGGALDRAAARARCEASLAGGGDPLRAAAGACLIALGDPPLPAPEGLADLPRPPFAAATQPLRWTVDTTRGVIVIALDPEVAPWSVGALAELSRRGFYGDLFWHRVVPGFVVQGGDPTGTGAGGPGFTLPGEPSFRPYARGAVGIADAGLHTGGSQWFIMHARAPHLEGRYTLVGDVIEGLDVAMALTTDDRILGASVEAL